MKGFPVISWILRKFKRKEDRTMIMMRNGESVLKDLIASSNGKYNPFRIFCARELKMATNNYDQQNLIRKDFAYKLYKGVWQDRLISVIKFEDDEEIAYKWCINNIVYASQMRHKHILKLIGCCLETQIPILAFEYVESRSLCDRIHGSLQPHLEPLLWTNRLKIAMDIAFAVVYLHLGFSRPIIFRDIKSSNVLFNKGNVVKLFDFSLSKSIPEDQTHIKFDVVMGTNGYIAYEYWAKSEYNEKSDVYSFGVLLIELLTGRKAYELARAANAAGCYFMEYLKKPIENNKFMEIVDPIIVEDKSWPEKEKEKQLKIFAQLIIECVNISPEKRPTMIDVTKQLRQMYRSCM